MAPSRGTRRQSPPSHPPDQRGVAAGDGGLDEAEGEWLFSASQPHGARSCARGPPPRLSSPAPFLPPTLLARLVGSEIGGCLRVHREALPGHVLPPSGKTSGPGMGGGWSGKESAEALSSSVCLPPSLDRCPHSRLPSLCCPARPPTGKYTFSINRRAASRSSWPTSPASPSAPGGTPP